MEIRSKKQVNPVTNPYKKLSKSPSNFVLFNYFDLLFIFGMYTSQSFKITSNRNIT